MTARLSTRISLRWLPDPPSEPTDTLVMSVGDFYLDLRITKSGQSIDWAMAGQRLVLSESPLKCKWTHTIDSRGYTDPDEGSFQDLPNGDSLETGSMPCPEKGGAVTPYEEVWRELSFPTGVAWVLQCDDEEGTTFLGRVSDRFLALRQAKDGLFSAKRELLQGEQWSTEYFKGNKQLACISQCPSLVSQEMAKLSPGDRMIMHGLDIQRLFRLPQAGGSIGFETGLVAGDTYKIWTAFPGADLT